MTKQQKKFLATFRKLLNDYEWVLRNLDVHVTAVNPKTGSISKDESKNTQLEFWLETGPWDKDCGWTHDPRLDCGGATFEEAITNLLKYLKKYYRPMRPLDVMALIKRVV